jgi:hypothetical protein
MPIAEMYRPIARDRQQNFFVPANAGRKAGPMGNQLRRRGIRALTLLVIPRSLWLPAITGACFDAASVRTRSHAYDLILPQSLLHCNIMTPLALAHFAIRESVVR